MENPFEEVLAGISEPDHYYYDRINSVLDYINEILKEKSLSAEDLNKALNLDEGEVWSDLLENDFFLGITQVEFALKMPILVTTRKGEDSQKGGSWQPSSLADNLKPGKATPKAHTTKPKADKPKKAGRATNESKNAYQAKADESNKGSKHNGKPVRSKSRKIDFSIQHLSQRVTPSHFRK